MESQIEEFARRVKTKINSFTYTKDLFCYLLVEELLLLFNVPAVFVLCCTGKGEEILRDADSNITNKDINILHKCRNDSHQKILKNNIEYYEFTPSKKPSFSNGNLAGIDREVAIEIDESGFDTSLEIRLWFSNNEIASGSVLSGMNRAEIPWGIFVGEVSRLLFYYRNVRFESKTPTQSTTDRGTTGFLEKKGAFFIQENVKKLIEVNDGEKLIPIYNSVFKSLDEVLKRIQFKLDEVSRSIHNHLKIKEGSYNFIYSYRSEHEKTISFFMTSEKMQKLLIKRTKNKMTTKNLQDLLLFSFSRGFGLSGYIMETGHSEFCAYPDDDPRWKKQKVDNFKEIQLLIARFHSDEVKEEQPQMNIYLVPLCVKRGEKQDLLDYSVRSTELLLAVECELSCSEEDMVEDQLFQRRCLFDVAWEFLPFVELAIVGQQAIERRYEEKTRALEEQEKPLENRSKTEQAELKGSQNTFETRYSEQFKKFHKENPNKNVFVSINYEEGEDGNEIAYIEKELEAIKDKSNGQIKFHYGKSLKKWIPPEEGLIANAKFYLMACDVGFFFFTKSNQEVRDEKHNSNVIHELGMTHGLGQPSLVLKYKNLPTFSHLQSSIFSSYETNKDIDVILRGFVRENFGISIP